MVMKHPPWADDCSNGVNANTPNFSSRHRYARGLKTTVSILPPLRGSVMIIVLSVGYASLTHGWGPVAPTGLKSGVLARRHHYFMAGAPH